MHNESLCVFECVFQVVALKFISKTKKTEKEVKSLRREIDIMRSLRHPNIVQMLDSFDTDHDVVVVTEFAQGELFQILQDDRTLPEEQVYVMLCAWLAVQVRGRKLLIWYTGTYVLATNRLGVRRVSNLSVSFGLGFLGLGLMLWLVELELSFVSVILTSVTQMPRWFVTQTSSNCS